MINIQIFTISEHGGMHEIEISETNVNPPPDYEDLSKNSKKLSNFIIHI